MITHCPYRVQIKNLYRNDNKTCSEIIIPYFHCAIIQEILYYFNILATKNI